MNEILKDILHELRELSVSARPEIAKQGEHRPMVFGKPIALYFADLADRIEAALTKEPENANNGSEICTIGNMAAMREAAETVYNVLEKLKPVALHLGNVGRMREFNHLVCAAKNRLDFALAAPARNCDRPECASLEMATKTWIREEFGPYCNGKATTDDIRSFDVWAYAPAKKQEGGADGSK